MSGTLEAGDWDNNPEVAEEDPCAKPKERLPNLGKIKT